MKKLIKYLYVILLSVSFQLSVCQQLNESNLLNELKLVKEDTAKVKVLNAICRQYLTVSNYDSAMHYAEITKTLAKKLISSSELAFKKLGTLNLALVLKNMGGIYYRLGDFSNSIDCYFNSLRLYDELKDKKGASNSLIGIANVYYAQGDYIKSLEQYYKALKIKEEIGDKNGVATSLNNISSVYYRQGNFEKALEENFKSIAIREKLGVEEVNTENILGLANSIGNNANIYENLSDRTSDKSAKEAYTKKALELYLRTLKIYEDIGNKYGIATTYTNLGPLHVKLKQYKLASECLNKALKLSLAIGSKNEIKFSYKGLSEVESELGNYKKSLEYYKLYVGYRDSLLNEEDTKKTVKLEMNYEFEKRELRLGCYKRKKTL